MTTHTSTPPVTIGLAFQAGEDASGPLTWAQRTMWGPMQWFGEQASQFTMTRTVVLSVPVIQKQLLTSLGRLIESHQTLRSHYRESGGVPQQQVSSSGFYEVTIRGDEGDPLQAANELAATLAKAAFDHEAEWPLRVGCVINEEQMVTAIALAVSHLGFDGWALATLASLLHEDACSTGEISEKRVSARTGLQPLEQAAFQQSAVGQAQDRLGLQHWERGLSTAPASMFDMPPSDVGPFPIERHYLDSSAVTAAGLALAARSGTSLSTVLLCLTTAALTAYTGHDMCALKLIAGNRRYPKTRDLVALNALDAWLTVPTADADLVTAVRRVHHAALEAYRRAECDPLAVASLIAETGRRRGVSFDLSTYFNSRNRGSDWEPTAASSDAHDLSRLRRESRRSSLASLPKSDMKFCLAAAHRGGAMTRLSLLWDTRYLPAPLGQQILSGFEEVLCAAVAREVGTGEIGPLMGIVPAVHGPRWERTATGWVDLEAAGELARVAASASHAAAFGSIGRVIACLAGPRLDPRALHDRVLDLLPGHPGAAAPDEYIVCPAAPALPAALESWLSAPAAIRVPGRRPLQ